MRPDGKVRYSPAEKKIFALLRTTSRDTTTIARLYYGQKNGGLPFNGGRIVVGALRSLERKARHNHEAFAVGSTRRAGPRPMKFWLEPRR